MYWFKIENRNKILQGRTVRFVAGEKLCMNETYLSSILNGNRGCSKILARSILNLVGSEEKLENYFEKKTGE